MADFATFVPPLTYTQIFASTVGGASPLSNSVAINTPPVPIGAGQFPYENYATGVEFVILSADGTTAPGNTTVTFQTSMDNTTWFTIPAMTFTGVLPTVAGAAAGADGVGLVRFSMPVNSREWRFVRLQFLCSVAQTPSAESTVVVRAKLQGLRTPFTKS